MGIDPKYVELTADAVQMILYIYIYDTYLVQYSLVLFLFCFHLI